MGTSLVFVPIAHLPFLGCKWTHKYLLICTIYYLEFNSEFRNGTNKNKLIENVNKKKIILSYYEKDNFEIIEQFYKVKYLEETFFFVE